MRLNPTIAILACLDHAVQDRSAGQSHERKCYLSRFGIGVDTVR